MKTLLCTVLAAVVACIGATSSWAQSPAPATKPAMPKYYTIRMPGMGDILYDELVKAAELTEEQQAKFVKIEQQRAAENKEKDQAAKEAQAKMMEAYGTGDRDKIQKAMGAWSTANMAVYESQNKAQAEMLALLKPEQKAKWKEYMVLRGMKFSFYSLKPAFDDKQWDKILAAYEKLAKDPDATPMQLQTRLIAETEKVLTPEQKLLRAKQRYPLMDKTVKFTDEQWKEIVKIEEGRMQAWNSVYDQVIAKTKDLEKAMAAAHASGDEAAVATVQKQWAEAYKPMNEFETKMQEKIKALLTDKQKAAWAEFQKNQPKPLAIPLDGKNGGVIWSGGGQTGK